MRSTASLFFLALSWNLFSQMNIPLSFVQKTTRAVVIGISQYGDPHISPLSNPKKDALYFTAFLKSRSGGNLADDQVRLLINEEATAGNMVASLDWLTDISREGDRIIIYFSGYGNPDTGGLHQPAFLMPYDAPTSAFKANKFPYNLFKTKLVNIARHTGLELVLIADTYFFEPIAQQASNIILPSSSPEPLPPPNELAITAPKDYRYATAGFKPENSRNSFTHKLIGGLMGWADKNADGVISIQETGNYLNEEMALSSLPPSMFYLLTDKPETCLAKVDEKILNQLKTNMESIVPAIVQLETSAFENKSLQRSSPQARGIYDDFVVAIQIGHLLFPEGSSANDYYEKMLKIPDSRQLQNILKRKLAAALQDESQQAINAYLDSDPAELTNRWKYNETYANYAHYLARAAELLGEKHYLHDHIRAKQYYFEGVAIRLEGEKEKRGAAAFLKAMEKLHIAENYEKEAAFIHNEAGLLHFRLGQPDSAIRHYHFAIELSPTWSIPHANLCIALGEVNLLEDAIYYGNKAIVLKENYVTAYNSLGIIYLKQKNYSKAENLFKKALKIDPSGGVSFYNLSCSKALRGKTHSAIHCLQNAFKNGYYDCEHVKNDPDLEHIRGNREFEKLIADFCTN